MSHQSPCPMVPANGRGKADPPLNSVEGGEVSESMVKEARAMLHGSSNDEPPDPRETDTVLGALLRLREAFVVLGREIIAPVRPLYIRMLDGMLAVVQRIAIRRR